MKLSNDARANKQGLKNKTAIEGNIGESDLINHLFGNQASRVTHASSPGGGEGHRLDQENLDES